MDEQIIQDILTEVFSYFEPLDAQTSALLQFLKAKGLATDEELAPFLEQAGNASNVRWRAARIRIASLLSSALTPTLQSAPSQPAAPAKTSEAPAEQSRSQESRDSKEAQDSYEKEKRTNDQDRGQSIPKKEANQQDPKPQESKQQDLTHKKDKEHANIKSPEQETAA